MWPFKDVYGLAAPLRSILGLVAMSFSYNSTLPAALALFLVVSFFDVATFFPQPRIHLPRRGRSRNLTSSMNFLGEMRAPTAECFFQLLVTLERVLESMQPPANLAGLALIFGAATVAGTINS